MEDKITRQKIDRYHKLTEKALDVCKKSAIKGKEKKAGEIIEMAGNYLSDAKYFADNNNLVNAFAAINYAHGWLDAGVRLGIFKTKDDRLFTVK